MRLSLALLSLFLPLLAGCGGSGSAGTSTAASSLDHLTVQLGEGANDGFYAALAKGFYAEAGLDVNLQAGKPGFGSVDTVMHDRADLGADRADSVKEAQKRGADVVVIGTAGKTVFARGDWLKKAGDAGIAKRFLAASAKGWAFCTANKGARACQS